jgi:excisionase family DNA binding protein
MSQTAIQPLAISVSEACQLLGLSRFSINQLLRNGVIKSRKVGRRVLVLTQSLQEFVAA